VRLLRFMQDGQRLLAGKTPVDVRFSCRRECCANANANAERCRLKWKMVMLLM